MSALHNLLPFGKFIDSLLGVETSRSTTLCVDQAVHHFRNYEISQQQDKQVFSVQRMQSFRVLATTAGAAPAHGDPYLNLQTACNALRIADLQRVTTGRGVRIALIDTGVYTEHPDLQGLIRYSENTAPEPADQNRADLHGMAVAGVLAARPDSAIGIAGIAPETDV